MIKLGKKNLIFCDCGFHAIQLEYDEDINSTYMSFFQYGHTPHKRDFKDILRMVWKVITTGNPYADDIILNEPGRLALIQVLQEYEPAKESIILTTNTGGQDENRA